MKKNVILSALVLILALSCKQNKTKEQDENATTDTISTSPSTTQQQNSPSSDSKFDINNIPLANDFEGAFPYFILPEGYIFADPKKYHGKGVIKDFDKEFFLYHGMYFPMEGKSFKAEIRVDSEQFKDKVFSKLEIQKSFDELIKNIGGEKINNGELFKNGEKDRLKSEAPNAFSDGYTFSSDNWENIHTYVIKTKDKTVFVQYNLGTENSCLCVLEPKALENKMSIIPAAEIKKQLDEKGKAILYINFDTDKATLKPEGNKYIEEIAKLLDANKDLKLSIEGHTDNSGNTAHNKTLSEERAKTVLNSLISKNIDRNRLKSVGFGSDKPLVANNTEENKAKNRRVELVKL
jgi:outer membrane protein OmpA-like peptidoglycan-associated protein